MDSAKGKLLDSPTVDAAVDFKSAASEEHDVDVTATAEGEQQEEEHETEETINVAEALKDMGHGAEDTDADVGLLNLAREVEEEDSRASADAAKEDEANTKASDDNMNNNVDDGKESASAAVTDNQGDTTHNDSLEDAAAAIAKENGSVSEEPHSTLPAKDNHDAAAAAKESVGAVAPAPQDISKEGSKGNITVGSTVSAQSTATSFTASVPMAPNAALIQIPTITILPPLSLHLAGMDQLDIISIECQKFLIDLGMFTASVFLSSDVGDLAEKYQAWRKKTALQDPSASRASIAMIAAGSARIYLNRWRKRLRDSLEATGMSRVEDLGVDGMVDYVIASPDRVNEAEKDRQRKEQSALDVTTATMSNEKLAVSVTNTVVRKPRYSLPASTKLQARAQSMSTAADATKFVTLTLSEPGTFGLKVENTATNGVHISDVLSGLQGERAGFQKGDVVASASFDTTNFEPDLSALWGQDMIFDEFVRLAQSQRRPIVVRVRRGGPDSVTATSLSTKQQQRRKTMSSSTAATIINTKNKTTTSSSEIKTFAQKRSPGRPRKPENELKRRRRGTSTGSGSGGLLSSPPGKRVKLNEKELHLFEVKKLRTMREELMRAHGLRVAAEAYEMNLVKALKHCPIAMQKAKEHAQMMHEESNEIWNYNPNCGEWETHFKSLLEFKQANGHVNVPRNHPDKELLKFVSYMKGTHKSLLKGEYKKARRRDMAAMEVDMFDKLGFKWQPINRTKDWEVGFEELVDYTNKHDGSCVVPKQKKKGEYASLYAWVLLQRRKYQFMQSGETDTKKSGKLSDDQIESLNELGFAWTVADERSWDSYFEDLLEYKLKHGHCKVPATYNANKPLAAWVDRMRQLKVSRDANQNNEDNTTHPNTSNQSKMLTEERFKMLNYFGFAWEGRKRRTSTAKGGAGGDEEDEEEKDDAEAENSDVEMYESAKASVSGVPISPSKHNDSEEDNTSNAAAAGETSADAGGLSNKKQAETNVKEKVNDGEGEGEGTQSAPALGNSKSVSVSLPRIEL